MIPEVSELLHAAADTFVLPVYRQRNARPLEKSPRDWVTSADRAAEGFLAPALISLPPGSLIVGEEDASGDERVLDRLGARGWVWLLDPLDGTANFASGDGPISMMVALLRDGESVASWMLDPLTGSMCVVERGSGAWMDGSRVVTDNRELAPHEMTGAVLRRFLPELLDEHITAAQGSIGEVTSGSKCAGYDYPAIASGHLDFVLYWRTLPWDPRAWSTVPVRGRGSRDALGRDCLRTCRP